MAMLPTFRPLTRRHPEHCDSADWTVYGTSFVSSLQSEEDKPKTVHKSN